MNAGGPKNMFDERKQSVDGVNTLDDADPEIYKELLELIVDVGGWQLLHDIIVELGWMEELEEMYKNDLRQKYRIQGKLEAAQSLLKKGMDMETVSSLLDLPIDTIKNGVQPGQMS
jgi:hypothetical protein